MCKCTPSIRTPYCGKLGCTPPNPEQLDYTKTAPQCPFWGERGSCTRIDKRGKCDGCEE